MSWAGVLGSTYTQDTRSEHTIRLFYTSKHPALNSATLRHQGRGWTRVLLNAKAQETLGKCTSPDPRRSVHTTSIIRIERRKVYGRQSELIIRNKVTRLTKFNLILCFKAAFDASMTKSNITGQFRRTDWSLLAQML